MASFKFSFVSQSFIISRLCRVRKCFLVQVINLRQIFNPHFFYLETTHTVLFDDLIYELNGFYWNIVWLKSVLFPRSFCLIENKYSFCFSTIVLIFCNFVNCIHDFKNIVNRFFEIHFALLITHTIRLVFCLLRLLKRHSVSCWNAWQYCPHLL